jgi:DNA-binding SARP family transcriptional activator/TolB-like protein
VFQLRLFGGVSLAGADGVVSGKAARRHPLALLALVALSPQRRVSRDKLIAYLWPDSPAARARNLLNQTIHALRQALGRDAIRSVRDELELDPQMVQCDVWGFQEAVRSDDDERALDVYTGPLADGFFLENAGEFERAMEAERLALRRSYLALLERLAMKAAAQGDSRLAATRWRRLAAEEPANASTVVRLMQALEALGDRAGAIREAEAHAALLHDEFGAEPNPAVLTLAERMRLEPAGFPIPPSPQQSADGRMPVGHGRETAAGGGHAGRFSRNAFRRLWRGGATAGAGLALLALGGAVLVNGPRHQSGRITSLAVLPLANFTGDPQQDAYVNGLHDVLVAELGRIADVTVISRQSTLRYRGSELPAPAIARELGVEALVEGSVTLAADSVRVTVQLVRAEPEEHLWAATYHTERPGALTLQGKVARAIVQAAGASVTPVVPEGGAGRPPTPSAAQDAYLRGLYHLERQVNALRPLESSRMDSAIAYLEEAVALAPGWAAAYAKLSLAYLHVASGGAGDFEAEFFPKAKTAALRALELDETQAQAHASLGFALLHYEWDWAAAERELRRAHQLEPNIHAWSYGGYLSAAGRYDEAVAQFQRAEERNPLSENVKLLTAQVHSCAGRHDRAIAKIREVAAVIGDSTPRVHLYLGYEYLEQSLYAEAIAELEAAVTLADGDPTAAAGLGYAYARAGRLDDARPLSSAAGPGSVVDRWPAPALLAVLGDTARAVAMIESAFETERAGAPHFRCTWAYRELRGNPRVQELMRRVGFPD